jgi:hypothetical protein
MISASAEKTRVPIGSPGTGHRTGFPVWSSSGTTGFLSSEGVCQTVDLEQVRPVFSRRTVNSPNGRWADPKNYFPRYKKRL